MIQKIKNSSGKVTGQITITDDKIIINNMTKPTLIINDKTIIQSIKQKELQEDIIKTLYDDYTLTIGEIAAIYNRCYSNINRFLREVLKIKQNKKGRRNRAYGKSISKEQSQKMSKALKGRKAPVYIRTDETKKKISDSLKEYYKNHKQNPNPHIQNWKNGVYDNVDFHIGIAGHFTSIKINKIIRFRSLLELYYLLLIEEDNNITTFEYEPFHIDMKNGRSYMPDFLIDNKIVVELKSKKYVERVSNVKEELKYKIEQAKLYCEKKNLLYQIIYDEDIGFNTKKMKYYIKNHPELVRKYNITFIDPSRMVI